MPQNPRTASSPGQDARRRSGALVDIKTQRTLAKAGVLLAMGVLVWSGMQRPRRGYMGLHSLTGMALIGFTLWHWSLYDRRGEDRPRRSQGRPQPSALQG